MALVQNVKRREALPQLGEIQMVLFIYLSVWRSVFRKLVYATQDVMTRMVGC